MASLSEFDREQAILLELDEHGRVEVTPSPPGSGSLPSEFARRNCELHRPFVTTVSGWRSTSSSARK